MKSYVYRVELEQDAGSGLWSAVVPALPGCAADAETEAEALEVIQDMARMYIEVLLEDGRPIPLEVVASGSEGAAIAVVA